MTRSPRSPLDHISRRKCNKIQDFDERFVDRKVGYNRNETMSQYPCKTRTLLASIFLIGLVTSGAFSPSAVTIQRFQRNVARLMPLSERMDDADETIEAQKLQAELNKLTEDLPMFASFDASNMDQSAIPIPMFTAIIIAIGSIIWTYYLFDIGINGFPTQ